VSLPASSFALPSLLAVLAVGLLGTAAAYLIMGTLVGRVGSVRASFITYLIPVVALFLGVLLRGDRVGTPAIAGVVLAHRRRLAGRTPRTLTVRGPGRRRRLHTAGGARRIAPCRTRLLTGITLSRAPARMRSPAWSATAFVSSAA